MTRQFRHVLRSTVTVSLLAVARLSAGQESIVDLGMPPGATDSHAFGINARGQIAGYASVSNNSRPSSGTGVFTRI